MPTKKKGSSNGNKTTTSRPRTKKGYKVAKGKSGAVKRGSGVNIVPTKAQKIQHRTGQMRAAQKKDVTKRIKKAGGTKKYLDKQKATKSNLIKYKGAYHRKSSPQGKAALKARSRKK